MLEVTSYLQVSRWEGRRHMVTLGGGFEERLD